MRSASLHALLARFRVIRRCAEQPDARLYVPLCSMCPHVPSACLKLTRTVRCAPSCWCVQDWEQFRVVHKDDGKVALALCVNSDLYMSAQEDGGIANNRRWATETEEWRVIPVEGGVTLQSHYGGFLGELLTRTSHSMHTRKNTPLHTIQGVCIPLRVFASVLCAPHSQSETRLAHGI